MPNYLTFFSGPQSGVIGPLLLIIYINDIAIEGIFNIQGEINLFVDDAKMFSKSNVPYNLLLIVFTNGQIQENLN